MKSIFRWVWRAYLNMSVVTKYIYSLLRKFKIARQTPSDSWILFPFCISVVFSIGLLKKSQINSIKCRRSENCQNHILFRSRGSKAAPFVLVEMPEKNQTVQTKTTLQNWFPFFYINSFIYVHFTVTIVLPI